MMVAPHPSTRNINVKANAGIAHPGSLSAGIKYPGKTKMWPINRSPVIKSRHLPNAYSSRQMYPSIWITVNIIKMFSGVIVRVRNSLRNVTAERIGNL